MDALGLFSSGLFSGYSIIWAGGGAHDTTTTANGAYLIITSAVDANTRCALIGIIVIKNGTSAVGGCIGTSGNSIAVSSIGFSYSGDTVNTQAKGWSGIIIA